MAKKSSSRQGSHLQGQFRQAHIKLLAYLTGLWLLLLPTAPAFLYPATAAPHNKASLLSQHSTSLLTGRKPRLTRSATATVIEEKTSGGSVLLLGRLIGNVAFWCLVYTLFFKGTSIITAVVEKSPSLEFACFLALSCLPVWLVRSGWARWAVDVPLETIASAMRRGGMQHVVRSCIEPVHMLTSGLLLFFAVNFLAQSAPANFAVELPPHFVTLDPNGDGILTAGELQTVVATFSTRLLHALSYFELGRFGFSALQKPEGYEAKGEALLDRYWNGIEMRTAVHVAAFLLMNGGLVLLTANGILRSLGLQPRSILAFGSVGGLAFGLASQNLVSNFMSGLLLIVNKPFKVGDTIETNGVSGKVIKQGWIFVHIASGDDVVILPNSAAVNTKTIQLGILKGKAASDA